MIIEAQVRIQGWFDPDCTPVFVRRQLAFVRKPKTPRGAAKVETFRLIGSSWAHIRRMARRFGIKGASRIGPATVECFMRDIGKREARIFWISDGLISHDATGLAMYEPKPRKD